MMVLVVDDSPEIQTVLPKMLDFLGFKSAVAVDGKEGLTVFRSLKPDLVLCEINVPGIDGIQLFTKVQESEESAEIPWMMVSSLDRRVDALAAGCKYFLAKPFNLRGLEEGMRTAMRSLKPTLEARYGQQFIPTRYLDDGDLPALIDNRPQSSNTWPRTSLAGIWVRCHRN